MQINLNSSANLPQDVLTTWCSRGCISNTHT